MNKNRLRTVLAALAASLGGIAAFVLIVTALADGPARTKAKHPRPAPTRVMPPEPAPAQRGAAPEFPQLLGSRSAPAAPEAPAAAPETAVQLKPEIQPIAAAQPTLADRLRFALHKGEECMQTRQAIAAIEEVATGQNLEEVIRALRALKAEDGWCDNARAALEMALNSATMSRFALLDVQPSALGASYGGPALTSPGEGGGPTQPGGGTGGGGSGGGTGGGGSGGGGNEGGGSTGGGGTGGGGTGGGGTGGGDTGGGGTGGGGDTGGGGTGGGGTGGGGTGGGDTGGGGTGGGGTGGGGTGGGTGGGEEPPPVGDGGSPGGGGGTGYLTGH